MQQHMFPLRAGRSDTISNEQLLMQCVAASAMHELGQQAALDTSILMFHQEAADVYYRTDAGIPIAENADGSYNLYTAEERTRLKKFFIDIVMKYHALSENGIGAQLTPLIDCMIQKVPVPSNVPLFSCICANAQQYSNAVFNHSTDQLVKDICDFSNLENITLEQSSQVILSSYEDGTDSVNVAIYEDDTVQCACDFCNKFYDMVEGSFDRTTLNFIQRILCQNYQF